MKSTAKLFSILLAAALILSVGLCPAYADDDPTGTITIKNPEKGISGSGGSYFETYSVYTDYYLFRILDLTGQDTSDPADRIYDAVSYTVAEKWEGFFTPAEDPADNPAGVGYLIAEADATAEQKASLNQIYFNGAVFYLNLTESNVAEFANAATRYAITATESVYTFADHYESVDEDAGDEIVIPELPLGYYLIVPWEFTNTFGTEPTEHSQGSIAALTSTVPNATIYPKAGRPTITKADDTISADIGQTVTYTITGKVPNTAGLTSYTYRFEDTMTSGLTYQNDLEITISPAEGEPIDITNNEGVVVSVERKAKWGTLSDYFTVLKVTVPVTDYQEYIGAEIKLVYSAVLNDNAIANNAERGSSRHEVNTVKLYYGHNPDSLALPQTLAEEVYTASIYIYKYTGEMTPDVYISRAEFEALDETEQAFYYVVDNPEEGKEYIKPAGTGTPLPGAKFALMNSEGKYLKYTMGTKQVYDSETVQPIQVPSIQKVSWVTVDGAPTPTTTVVTDAMAGALAAAAKAGTITAVESDAEGRAAFEGIHDDSYRLVEIEAPAGYNRVPAPQIIEVQGIDRDYEGNELGKTENIADVYASMDSSSDAFSSVLNQSGALLPVTGGIGTTLLYTVGGTMTLAAAALLLTRKKRSES